MNERELCKQWAQSYDEVEKTQRNVGYLIVLCGVARPELVGQLKELRLPKNLIDMVEVGIAQKKKEMADFDEFNAATKEPEWEEKKSVQ